MNNKTAGWVIVVLLIIVGGVYLISRSNERAGTNTTTTTTGTTAGTTTGGGQQATAAVNYYCSQGSIVATYADNSVALALSDGRTMTLAQGISGSGVRYASADGLTVFDTKGNNAFLTEKNVNTYDNCVTGTQTAAGTNLKFTDGNKLFTFIYPNSGTLSGSLGYDANWRLNTQTLGLLLAQVTIPRTIQPNTNFGDAKFTVGTSSDPAAVSTCLTDNLGGASKGTLVTINGVQYTKLTSGDAAAGNRYDTTSYRTVRDGQCYALEYTIHYGNFQNYDPSTGVKEFNEPAVTAIMDSIVQSFKFL